MGWKTVDDFAEDYKHLADSGSYSWERLDEALMALCKGKPGHDDVNKVFAKVALINRGYRTNLHRGAKDAEWKVAEQFVKRKADAILAPLEQGLTFSAKNLTTILDVHETLVKVAYRVTKKVENSFVSKYLHFHFPETVPIFDSYASWNSKQLAKRRGYRNPQFSARWTWAYAYHCGDLLTIMDHLRDCEVETPKLKLIDVLLYESR